MPPPPPSKRSSGGVERGGGDVEDDPERMQGTQAKIKAPPVRRSRPAGASLADDEDPEVSKNTQARMPAAGADEDPEVSRNTMQKVPQARPSVSRGGGDAEDDPERQHSTQAKMKAPKPKKGSPSNWEAPPGKMSREVSKAEKSYRTGSEYESLDEDPPEYSTGNDYEPLQDKELNLEGDGLDALDPDMGPPKTRGLDALLAEDADEKKKDVGDEDDGANETRAGPPLSLQITAGPDQGKKKKFKGVRMVIGRTPGVDLQLSDQSVSRRHVELVQGDKGVLLRDLGSGNGTKVNGEKVAEKVLEHGDEIHIGKTKLKFVDEMAAFKKLRDDAEKKDEEKKAEEEKKEEAAAPAEGEAKAEGEEAKAEGAEGAEGEAKAEGEGEGEAAAKEGEEAGPKTIARPALADREGRKPVARRGAAEPQGAIEKFKALEPKKKLMFGGAAALLLILLIVIASAAKPPAPPPVDPRAKAAAEKMQLARDYVRQGKYEEAIGLIEAAEKLQPGIDTTKLASSARDELAIQKSLELVKQAIEQNRFDDARTELARMGQGSAKTEEAKKAVEEQLKLAEAKFKRSKIDELLAAGELEAAKQLMAELPDSDQREVADKIAAAEAQMDELKKQQEADIKRQQINAQVANANRAAENMAIAFAVVNRKFAGNEWSRAAAECDRVIENNPGDDKIRKRAKTIQALIPNFGRNFEEGMKKFREGQIASSARPLRQARGLYQQIGLPNALGPEIDEKLSQAAVMAGKEALMRDDLASAAINFRDAVRLDPTEGRAKQGLDETINRAEDLYQSAYMIRDRDPREALKKFKVVVEVTPPGSATHEKAKNQIASMNP